MSYAQVSEPSWTAPFVWQYQSTDRSSYFDGREQYGETLLQALVLERFFLLCQMRDLCWWRLMSVKSNALGHHLDKIPKALSQASPSPSQSSLNLGNLSTVNVLTISTDLPSNVWGEHTAVTSVSTFYWKETPVESSSPYVLRSGPGIWGNAYDGNVTSSKVKYTHQAKRERGKCMPSLTVVA